MSKEKRVSVHELPNSEFFVVQLPSYIRLFATPWTAALQAPLSSTVFQSLLKLIFIKSVMLSNHRMLYDSSPPVFIFPSINGVFSNESVLRIRLPRVLELQLQYLSPSNEYLELISIRIDQFDLLAVQAFWGLFSHSVVSDTYCDPMDCSTPDFPVLHYLPQLAHAHVH